MHSINARLILIGFLAIAVFSGCRTWLTNAIDVRPSPTPTTPASVIAVMPNDGNVSPPVIISKVRRSFGKPPLQGYRFDLQISPRREGLKWIIFSGYLDKPLPENGVFANDYDFDPPVDGDRYASAGPVVVISGYGSRRFRALRPAEGKVKLNRFHLSAWSDKTDVEVWEVESLLVNGETPLEEWLPFDSTSYPTAKAVDDSDWEQKTSLRFETNVIANRTGTYVPKGKVNFIKAVGIRRWILPFKFIESDRF